jgi:hypothetical protein
MNANIQESMGTYQSALTYQSMRRTHYLTFFYNFIIFKLHSTTEPMPALVSTSLAAVHTKITVLNLIDEFTAKTLFLCCDKLFLAISAQMLGPILLKDASNLSTREAYKRLKER